jgi:hypothetical protein
MYNAPLIIDDAAFFYQLSWSACFGISCNILTVAIMESHAAKKIKELKDVT